MKEEVVALGRWQQDEQELSTAGSEKTGVEGVYIRYVYGPTLGCLNTVLKNYRRVSGAQFWGDVKTSQASGTRS